MSDNNAIQTRDEPNAEPVVTGPSKGEVKKIDVVDDDHPLVEETGDAALETQTSNGAGEFLSDFIYENDEAWTREWQQNHETACVRAAKLKIRQSDEYPDGWLTVSLHIDAETGEGIDCPPEEYDGETRTIEIPRPISEVIEAARSLGYDPTIVWDIYRDELKIITEDNGIGMTPYEFDEAFNTIFNSGSGVDGETGGMFGVGSESSALVHGNDGGAEVETRSRRPGNYTGFRAYSYLGGANALPGEVPDGFYGTRFDIPVQTDYDLSKQQDRIEKFADKLRVPLLYREHDAGATPVEEEYEATDFVDDYEDAPVKVERPGEFTVVAGPDVCPRTGYREPDTPDTYLVSMPIDRNASYSINSLWDVVIQIHDEQGRVVMGPNRGRYSDGSKVYPTAAKQREIGDLQEDDIITPMPTGSRDQLQRDSESKKFYQYIEKVVKSKEMEQCSAIVEAMNEADHAGNAIRGKKSEWTLFRKLVSSHSPYKTLERERKFKKFIKDVDEFPDLSDEKVEQMFALFQEVEHCHRGAGRSSKKRSRTEKRLGEVLAENDANQVYMAASTGGKFTRRFKVLEHHYDDPTVIVINGRYYDPWQKHFGFGIVKEVPLMQDDEHDYDVPDSVHAAEKKEKKKSKRGKPDEVLNRALKIRNDGDSQSIDIRLTIKDAKERLESGNGFGNGKRRLILFTRGDGPNISDHYDMANYAAIACVSKSERAELEDYDRVMTFAKFRDWSRTALIATEEGAMTPADLLEDDRMVVLLYREYNHSTHKKHDEARLLSDDNEKLRQLYCEDIRDQISWTKKLDNYDGGYNGDDESDVDDDEKADTLFAVAGNKVLKRAEWAFDNHDKGIDGTNLQGLRLGRNYYGMNICRWKRLDGSQKTYELMADTPNWDDESDIYHVFPSNHESREAQMYLGFHDRGIDPTEQEPEELRELIK